MDYDCFPKSSCCQTRLEVFVLVTQCYSNTSQDQSQINMEVLMRPGSIPDALVEDERIEARCLEVLLRPAPIPEDSLSEKYPIVSQLLRKYPIPDYASLAGHVAASQQQRHVAQQQQQRAADAAEEQQRRVASSRAAAARSLRKCQESSSSSSSGMLPPATPYAAMLR